MTCIISTTLIFKHKVYYNVICAVISDMFIHCYNVHPVNTTSHLFNFCLNDAETSVRKSFIVFSGALLLNGISIDLEKLNSLQLFKSKIIDDVIYRYI